MIELNITKKTYLKKEDLNGPSNPPRMFNLLLTFCIYLRFISLFLLLLFYLCITIFCIFVNFNYIQFKIYRKCRYISVKSLINKLMIKVSTQSYINHIAHAIIALKIYHIKNGYLTWLLPFCNFKFENFFHFFGNNFPPDEQLHKNKFTNYTQASAIFIRTIYNLQVIIDFILSHICSFLHLRSHPQKLFLYKNSLFSEIVKFSLFSKRIFSLLLPNNSPGLAYSLHLNTFLYISKLYFNQNYLYKIQIFEVNGTPHIQTKKCLHYSSLSNILADV